jgi:tetratricopeptide (TPR) repeat protein
VVVAGYLEQCAAAARKQNHLPDAEDSYRQALAIRRRLEGNASAGVAQTLMDLAGVLTAAGKDGDAELLLRECLGIRERALQRWDWQVPYTRSVLGESLIKQGKLKQAEPLLGDAYGELRSNPPPLSQAFRVREAIERLVALCEAQGKTEQAARWRARLPKTATLNLRPDWLDEGFDIAWGRTISADAWREDRGEVLALTKGLVEDAPHLPHVWQVRGWALYRAGDYRASIEALERSISLQSDPPGGDPWQWLFLAMNYWQLAERAQARAWYQEAFQWLDENPAQKSPEILRVREEAAKLLELPGKSPWQPLEADRRVLRRLLELRSDSEWVKSQLERLDAELARPAEPVAPPPSTTPTTAPTSEPD